MEHQKISTLQLFSLVFFLSHAFFLFWGNTIIKASGNDTLLACLLGTILNIFLIKILLWLRKKNINSPKIGNYILLPLFLLLTFVLLQQMSHFIQSNFLEQGNLLQIGILLILIAIIISKRNIPQVASLAFLCLIIFCIGFVSNIIGMVPLINSDHLKPLLTNGIMPILRGALLFSFYTILPLLLLLSVPYHNVTPKEKQNKYIYFALIISNLITIIQYTMISFGPSILAASTYTYPYMLIIHKISSFVNLDRIGYFISLYVLLDSTILLGFMFTLIKMLWFDIHNHFEKSKRSVLPNH